MQAGWLGFGRALSHSANCSRRPRSSLSLSLSLSTPCPLPPFTFPSLSPSPPPTPPPSLPPSLFSVSLSVSAPFIHLSGGVAAVRHPAVAVYRTADMSLCKLLESSEDDLNIALFHPAPHVGFLYGTKQGKIRMAAPLRDGPPSTNSRGGGNGDSSSSGDDGDTL